MKIEIKLNSSFRYAEYLFGFTLYSFLKIKYLSLHFNNYSIINNFFSSYNITVWDTGFGDVEDKIYFSYYN